MRGLIVLATLVLASCAAERPVETWVDPLADCESIGFERVEIDREYRLRDYPMRAIDVPVCRDR